MCDLHVQVHTTPILSSHPTFLCTCLGRLSLRLLCLRASQLDRVLLLALRALALLDGRRTLHSRSAQIVPVSLVASRVDDLAVDSARARAGAEGGALEAGGGLVGLVGLLEEEGDAAVGGWREADRLGLVLC